jgi:alkyldihydroxyacetonephosphate synthase
MTAIAPGLDAGAISRSLAVIVGDRNLTSSPSALAELGLVRDDRAPAWLISPGAASEVAELIRLAGRERIAILPVGNAGRAPRAHSLTGRPVLMVSTRRMDHVLHLDETSLVVNVQVGLTGHALESILVPRSLSLGDFPPPTLGSTIGGLLAVRTPGKSTPRHGFFEDAVLGVSAVLADGRTIHTRVAPRRATGPDLARALCGSEGTLGFITSAVLRIHRRAESRLLAAFALPGIDRAIAAAYLALREDAAPAALRIFDGDEARAHFGALWTAGHSRGEALLVVATAGPTDLAACDRDLVASAVTASGGTGADGKLADLWWRRRAGADEGAQPPPPALQVAASPSRLRTVYAAVRAATARAIPGAIARAHCSRFDGDGAVLFFTFADADGRPLESGQLDGVRTAAETAAAAVGGFLLGSANRELEPYLESLRKQLDPNDILNPSALR